MPKNKIKTKIGKIMSQLARQRWTKTTPEQRKAHMTMMSHSRQKVKPKNLKSQ